MKKSIFIIAFIVLAISGCKSYENDGNNTNGEYEKTDITFNGSFGRSDNDPAITYTTISDNYNGMALIPILWSVNDQLGVFSTNSHAIAENSRATITEGAGKRDGVFVSLGVGISNFENSQFRLYYPYDKNALDMNIAPSGDSWVRYVEDGDNSHITGLLPINQPQESPNNLEHFSKYGYSVAVTEPAPTKKAVNFTMEHILTYLELDLYGGGDLAGFKIEEINITVPYDKHIAGPFCGFFDGKFTPMPNATSTDYSNQVRLVVTNPEEITSSSATAQRFLVSMLPVDLTSIDFKIKVELSNGVDTRFYGKMLEGTHFKSDYLTKIVGDLDSWERIYPLRAAIVWEDGVKIDKSTVKLTSIPVSSPNNLANQVANSYIIRAGGTYSFPAQKPDGTWVPGIETGEYNHVEFTVPDGAKGNALIAVYSWDDDDVAGTFNTIVYSWHIWIADPQENVFNTVVIQDMFLGATSNTPGVESLGLYYQWGRKDPFPRANTSIISGSDPEDDTAFEPTSRTKQYDINTALFGSGLKWTQYRSKMSFEEADENPMSFIDGTVLYTDENSYFISDGHINMPSYDTSAVTEWNANMNPCPYGYSVATPLELFEIHDRVHTSIGVAGGGIGRIHRDDNNAEAWYPYMGFRNNEYGSLRALNIEINTWANITKLAFLVHETGKYGASVQVAEGGIFNPNANGRISSARPVRCVKK